MNEGGVLTLTCPHCNKPLRALAEYAGGQVRCPHPDCLQPVPVPVPLSLDDEEESDLPTVLPEPPTPQPVAAEAQPAKPPRKRRSADEDGLEPPSRAAVLPWAFATAAFLVAAVAVAGWALTVARAKPDEEADERVAALEAKNRALRADNEKLRGQFNPPKPAPKDKAPSGSAPSGTQTDNPPPRPPVKPAPVDEPQPVLPGPPAPIDPFPPGFPGPPPRPPAFRPPPAFPARPPAFGEPKPPAADGSAKFVGTWVMVDQRIQNTGLEVTIEFRADGTCACQIRGPGLSDDKTGKWRWDGKQLHVEVEGGGGNKPADVAWNGPDEFTVTENGMTVVLRRKEKAARK